MVPGRIAKRCLESKAIHIFTRHVTANQSVASVVETTVDVPYPNDFTYMLKTFSPSDVAVSVITR